MKGQLVRLPGRWVSLFVRSVGSGHPLLLMHGGPGVDHSTMLPFLPCADEFKLLLYDHRCNGRSSGADVSNMTWENLTADVEALRETMGIERWAVLGHSFGGMVALEYAIRYPEHLSHLCILDSGGDSRMVQENAPAVLGQKGFSKKAVAAARRFFNGQIGRGEFLRSMIILGRAYYSDPSPLFLLREVLHGLRIRSNFAAFIFGFSELLPGWSVMKQLGHIKTPTLIMAGRDDFQFLLEHQKLLAEGIPSAQLRIIDGAGHNAHFEQPKEVLAVVRQFLRS